MFFENIQQMPYSGYENRGIYVKEKSSNFCGHLVEAVATTACVAVGIGALVALSKFQLEFYAGRECQSYGLYDNCWDVYCHFEKVCNIGAFFSTCRLGVVCRDQYIDYIY